MSQDVPGSSPRSRRDAFTLIELLVVIAIIALLVSILVPSLSMANDLAKTTVCMTHLKNVGSGILQYDQKYGLLPPFHARYTDSNGKSVRETWQTLLALDKLVTHNTVEWGDVESKSVRMDPSDFKCPSGQTRTHTEGNFGWSANALAPRESKTFANCVDSTGLSEKAGKDVYVPSHYGANACDWIGAYPFPFINNGSNGGTVKFPDNTLAKINRPGDLVGVFDGCWRHNVNRWNMVKTPHNRFGVSNLMFLDGRVERANAANLPPFTGIGDRFGGSAGNYTGDYATYRWRDDQ